ncbi:MAG: electron transfer flavoprotein subunit beta/FixA family protein [bacterium]
MKIAVLVKQVPDSETRINLTEPAPALDDSGFTRVLNPYDAYAVEEAVQIKERTDGCEITAITIGPDRVKETLKKDCLAVGCDKAIIITDPALDNVDELGLAQVLAAAVKLDEYDLILSGIKAIDDDSGQVGIMVAELLGLPHVSVVTHLELGAGELTATREIEGAKEIVTAKLPALITCQKGLNEPRLPSLPNIMKAGAKPMETKTCADLGLEPPAPLSEIKLYSPPPARGQCRIVENDDPAAAAKELARLLREEAKVI